MEQLVVLGAIWLVAFLFSTTLHEAGHALAAYKLGDPTAYHGGQVSLNPIPHIRREPFGMIVVPILSFAAMQGAWMFGWASAPYDPRWAARHPRRAGWMALAGPVANLLLVVIAGVLLRIGLEAGLLLPPESFGFSTVAVAASQGGLDEGVAVLLSVLFSLNLVLFAFNLLPLPPLDGSAVILLFLPEAASRGLQQLLWNPMFGLVGILIAWKIFAPLFWPILGAALKVLYAGT